MQADSSNELKELVLNEFCYIYEGREEDIGFKPLVYGDLLLLSDSLNIPVKQIAQIILSEL